MIDTISISKNLARQFELVETQAWKDLYLKTSREAKTSCGISFSDVGSGSAVSISQFDILSFNRVQGIGLEDKVTFADIERFVTIYKTEGVKRFLVQISPYAEPDYLSNLLTQKGFLFHNNWVKLYRDVKNPPEIKSDLRVEQISVNKAKTFGEIFVTAFNWPSKLVQWIGALVGRTGWQHYLVYDGTNPVATAAAYIRGKYAWLDFASTLSEYCGRGAQSALISRRISDCAELGCKWLVTETAEETPGKPAPSFRNMTRLGFKVAYIRPNYLLVNS